MLIKQYLFAEVVMGRKNLLDKKIDRIETYFDSTSTKAYNYYKISELINERRKKWQISPNKSTRKVIEYLIKKDVLFINKVTNQNNELTEIYSWKTKDDLTVASAIKNNSYYSYYTALYLHGLTLQIPKTLYINQERPYDPNSRTKTELTQEAIDKAFDKPQRKSNNIYKLRQKKVIFLNGKCTYKLGVYPTKETSNSENTFYYYTDLERTLIDASVRPVYSGGVFEVLGAFKNARDRIDVYMLKNYLTELDYIYPYEQIIGFYLEKAGYPNELVSLFKKENKLKFYLTYQIRNKAFSKTWNLFYPKEME